MIRKGCNQKEILTTITSVCGLGVGEEKLNWQSGINTKRMSYCPKYMYQPGWNYISIQNRLYSLKLLRKMIPMYLKGISGKSVQSLSIFNHDKL